jgi:hypothetical protein
LLLNRGDCFSCADRRHDPVTKTTIIKVNIPHRGHE